MEFETPGTGSTQALSTDIFVDDAITYVRFDGTVGEQFNGKALAGKLKTKTIVLQLAEVKRITSFGIREWIEFMDTLAKRADDIIMVECASKIVDQVNMVANFTGPARVFSFFAPYRCDYCDEDNRVIMQIDRDWEVIKSMRPPELPCNQCGQPQNFDEDPVTYFSHIINQGQIELPEPVRVLLAAPSTYRPSVVVMNRRVAVDKLIQGNFTHILLSGDLDSSFPRRKLADGLEGTVVIDLASMGKLDPAGAAEWRSFLQMITPATDAIYITGMPPGFLEKLGDIADLGAKTQLLTFSMLYTCSRCGVSLPYKVDVESTHELLRFATPPEMECRECQAPASCAASRTALQHLSRLPKPSLSAEARAFVESVKGRKPKRSSTESGVVGGRRRSRGSGPLLTILAFIAALAAAAAVYLYTQKSGENVVEKGMGKPVKTSAKERPAWLTSDTPASGECKTDKSLQITCVGVSSLAEDQNKGGTQAREAAVEAAMRAIGLLIEDDAWAEQIGAPYHRIRQSKLTEFFNEGLREPGSLRYQRSLEAVINGRRAVVRAVQKTAGELMNTEKTQAEYWERYAPGGVDGPRFLVFVQYQIPGDIVEQLIDLYSKPVEALDARLVTAFPGLAWRYPEMDGGAAVIGTDDGVMKESGVRSGEVITEVQGRPIKDARAFEQVLQYQLTSLAQESGDLRLTVHSDKGTGKVNIPAHLFDDGGAIIE